MNMTHFFTPKELFEVENLFDIGLVKFNLRDK